MSAVLLFWLSHFYYFSRFLLEVFVLVVSLKTNFHSRKAKYMGMGKSSTNCPTLGGWLGTAHGLNGALKDAWTAVAHDIP